MSGTISNVMVGDYRRWRSSIASASSAGSASARLSMAQFQGEVGQVLLTTQPGPDFQPQGPSAAPFWRRFLRALLRMPDTRLPLIQMLGTFAMAQLLGLALPLLAEVILDRVIPHNATHC